MLNKFLWCRLQRSKNDFQTEQKLILNRVKIQSSKKPFKAKQVNIEAIQINLFFESSSQFFIFLSL